WTTAGRHGVRRRRGYRRRHPSGADDADFLALAYHETGGHRPGAVYRAGGGRRAWRPGGGAEHGRVRHDLYDHAASRGDVRETGGKGEWPIGFENNKILPTLPQSVSRLNASQMWQSCTSFIRWGMIRDCSRDSGFDMDRAG